MPQISHSQKLLDKPAANSEVENPNRESRLRLIFGRFCKGLSVVIFAFTVFWILAMAGGVHFGEINPKTARISAFVLLLIGAGFGLAANILLPKQPAMNASMLFKKYFKIVGGVVVLIFIIPIAFMIFVFVTSMLQQIK